MSKWTPGSTEQPYGTFFGSCSVSFGYKYFGANNQIVVLQGFYGESPSDTIDSASLVQLMIRSDTVEYHSRGALFSSL